MAVLQVAGLRPEFDADGDIVLYRPKSCTEQCDGVIEKLIFLISDADLIDLILLQFPNSGGAGFGS